MIAFLILLVIFCFFMAFRSIVKEKRRKESAARGFENDGFCITKKVRDLAIDENNQKWINLSSKFPVAHDFSEIMSVEINENGEKYKSQHGIMRAAVGGAIFGMAGALVGAGTAYKSREISHLSVDVYLNDLDNPIESFVLINTRTKTEGVLYQKLYESVKQMAALLTAMQRTAEANNRSSEMPSGSSTPILSAAPRPTLKHSESVRTCCKCGAPLEADDSFICKSCMTADK